MVTSEIDKLLGTIPDSKLAKLLGVSKTIIKKRREELGRKLYSPSDVWTEENLALLGTMPDKELALLLNVKEYLVSLKRRALKIKHYQSPDYKPKPNKNKTQWTEEMIADLGTMSDYKVAAKYGTSSTVVGKERCRRNIPPFKKVNRWAPAVNWTPELDALLGTMSDGKLATKLGVNQQVVYDRRTKLGIKAHTQLKHSKDWTDEELALLGTMPDSEVAAKIGCNRKTVEHKRRKLGIKGYSNKHHV